jgi:lysozyme family protein
MQDNFERALARTLIYEGGRSEDPNDPGGRTNEGVTQNTYTAWRLHNKLPRRSVYQMDNVERNAIYKNEYWDRIHGDSLPVGLDLCVFDAAVNSGVSTATKWLQAVLNLDVDGDNGTETRTAAGSVDTEATIKTYCARRLGSLHRLKTWKFFGKGWSARIANVQKIAVSWAEADSAEGDHPDTADVSSLHGDEKVDITDVKSSIMTQAQAHIGTAAAGTATATAQVGSTLAPAADAFDWLKYVLGGLTLAGAIAGVVVMISKQANDAAQNATASAPVDPNADKGLPTVAMTQDVQVAVLASSPIPPRTLPKAIIPVPLGPAPVVQSPGALS